MYFSVKSLNEKLFRIFFSKRRGEIYSISNDKRFEEDYPELGISKDDYCVRLNREDTSNKTREEIQTILLENKNLTCFDVLPSYGIQKHISLKDLNEVRNIHDILLLKSPLWLLIYFDNE